MSTPTDNQKSRKLNGKDFPTNNLTFGDKSGQYPKADYENASSVNKAARAGSSPNELDLSGSSSGVDLSDFVGGIESEYPLNQVIETEAGHVIEYNDSKTTPRILIKHADGHGIDLRPDGTVLVNAKGRGLVEVATGGHKLVVTGEGQVSYSGNLTLNVGGDFNLNVGGSYNVQAKDETKTINGPSRQLYTGNKTVTVKGSGKETYTENYTSAVLGGFNQFIKGDYQIAVQGAATYASKGVTSSSSETQMTQSSPDINIAATNLSVFGDTGTIGGENIIMYNYNMHTGHSVWAGDTVTTASVYADETMTSKEFIGSLTGNADTATQSGISGGPGGVAGTKVTGSAQAQDTKATALPTAAIIADYAKGNYGTRKVIIDEGDHYKSIVDKAVETEHVTDKPLNLAQVRAKKRDAGHNSSSKFNNYAIAAKQLNPNHVDTVPPAIGETRDSKKLTQVASNPLPDGDPSARVVPAVNKKATLSVDKQYNPNTIQNVTTATKLTSTLTLSEFAYGKGDPHGLDKSLSLEQKIQILRNLQPHAQIVSRIRKNKDDFKGYNLEIVEGLYIEHATEIITPGGILDLRKSGRAVVYQLVGLDGVTNKEKTYELASWIAKNAQFDKLILDYDTYDPFGDMNCQIVLITPEIPADYVVQFAMETETVYNGKKQDGGLLEILSEKTEPLDPSDQTDPAPKEVQGDEEDEDDKLDSVEPTVDLEIDTTGLTPKAAKLKENMVQKWGQEGYDEFIESRKQNAIKKGLLTDAATELDLLETLPYGK